MTKRVVVFGEYPPNPGPAAEATLGLVRAHLAAGADVRVVSPRPSAAHHRADLATARGAAVLARLTAGADLELVLDPAVMARGGAGRIPAQALLALAIRRARHSIVRLEPLRGPAGRGRIRFVLGSADSVLAASDSDAAALERAGIDRSRLSVRPSPAALPANTSPAGPERTAGAREPWGLSGEPGREELEAAVRGRAARDREAAAGNRAAADSPLRRLSPFAPPAPAGKPSAAVVKKVVYRLTAWVWLPLVEHVNRLHEATIESVTRQHR